MYQAYYAIEPFGPGRDDLRAGNMTAHLVAAMHPKDAVSVADMTLHFKTEPTAQQQPQEVIRARLVANAAQARYSCLP